MLDLFEIDVQPKPKLKKSHIAGLRRAMTRVDLWSFGKGLTINHANFPNHVGLQTPDKTQITLDSDGEIIIRSLEVDIAKIRTIEKLFPNFLRFVASSTKAQNFEGTIKFHTIVKETNLKHLIRATLQSAANPFLSQQFGSGAKVAAISISLTKERSILMTVPDDMDFFDEVEISTKGIKRGFLESHYSQAESYLNGLR